VSTIEILMRMAQAARIFRGSDGRNYASIQVAGHVECHALTSKGFRHWFTRLVRDALGRLPAPPLLMAAIESLDAQAEIDGETEPVFLRVGGNKEETSYFLDLRDSGWRAVEIRADGWQVVERPGVNMRRSAGQFPLPNPMHGGSIELLRKYVNVEDHDWPLLIGWMTAALRPVGPYCVLAVSGEHGSAKSTLADVCRGLIDPSSSRPRGLPKEERDLMVSACHNWVMLYDNITTLPSWFSDAACRLSTGGAYAPRKNFTDDEEFVLSAERPLILSGVENFVRKGDLADRSIFLHLPIISGRQRRGDRAFWADFNRDAPILLGALLDAVSAGIRLWPEVQLPELSRMADTERWGEAVARGLGWAPGTFVMAYKGNRDSASADVLEDSTLAVAIIFQLSRHGAFRGTPTTLLDRLCAGLNRSAAGRQWPKTPSDLSRMLGRLAPQLRTVGVNVEFVRERTQRLITITGTDRPSRTA
jgi:hypothetical protein